jgi:hypothetical protein
MTRREWLHKNPPPKAPAALRSLLEQLTAESNARTQLEAANKQWEPHIPYWNQQMANANAAQDVASMNHARVQLADVQNKIADIDKQLAASAELPARIAELKAELKRAATCPTHQRDLLRHKNRPDDLFLCDIGPHFFLWTKVGSGAKGVAQLMPVDINKPMPGLDETMEWIVGQ